MDDETIIKTHDLLRKVPERYVGGLIQTLEHTIGIGSNSGSVHESGEDVGFKILAETTSGPIMIFDVGANQGNYTSEALNRLGSRELEIHCFEPAKTTFEILSKKHGGDKRIKLNNSGLADERKKAILYMDQEGSVLASLTERKIEHWQINHGKIKEEVTIDTLDAYCREKEIDRIDLLKIDVEGHELDVLKGANELIKGDQVHLVQFEFGGCNIDTRTYFRDFYHFFNDNGFVLFRILPTSKLMPIPYYTEHEEKFNTMNYIAARRQTELRSFTVQ